MVYKPNNRPRNDWVRTSNCKPGKGERPGNKYDFSMYLKKVGDFVVTHPLPRADMLKIFYAAHIWAVRHHCRVMTERLFYPDDKVALHIELTHAVRNWDKPIKRGRRLAL